LLQHAVKANIPDAMYDLAMCLEKGDGIRKNTRRAFEFYLKSALRGYDLAFCEVGRCYYFGIGTKEDKHIGKMWFKRAEELGAMRSDKDD
jgi:TPR repeat protein